MKKKLCSLWCCVFAACALSLLLVSCGGGGGGGSDDDVVTPVAESGIDESPVVEIASPSVLEGFVSVPGATFNGTTAITGSSVFINGRTVNIPNLWVCDHEVTQGEYQAVMGSNPSDFSSGAADGETQANRPVENVSWYDAIMYCNKRSSSECKNPCYAVNGNKDTSQWNYTPHAYNSISGDITCDFTANGYRLPTEAEWEYLARGGYMSDEGQTTYSGSGSIDSVAWYTTNSGSKTHEVKKKTKNAKDLYDMSGNVGEWCWDRWAYTITTTTPSTGALSGSNRVGRGGDWSCGTGACSVAFRIGNYPHNRDSIYGFRVVRTAN